MQVKGAEAPLFCQTGPPSLSLPEMRGRIHIKKATFPVARVLVDFGLCENYFFTFSVLTGFIVCR